MHDAHFSRLAILILVPVGIWLLATRGRKLVMPICLVLLGSFFLYRIVERKSVERQSATVVEQSRAAAQALLDSQAATTVELRLDGDEVADHHLETRELAHGIWKLIQEVAEAPRPSKADLRRLENTAVLDSSDRHVRWKDIARISTRTVRPHAESEAPIFGLRIRIRGDEVNGRELRRELESLQSHYTANPAAVNIESDDDEITAIVMSNDVHRTASAVVDSPSAPVPPVAPATPAAVSDVQAEVPSAVKADVPIVPTPAPRMKGNDESREIAESPGETFWQILVRLVHGKRANTPDEPRPVAVNVSAPAPPAASPTETPPSVPLPAPPNAPPPAQEGAAAQEPPVAEPAGTTKDGNEESVEHQPAADVAASPSAAPTESSVPADVRPPREAIRDPRNPPLLSDVENLPRVPDKRPAWIDTPPPAEKGTFYLTDSAGPYSTRSECDAATPALVCSLARKYVSTYLNHASADELALDFDEIRRHGIFKEFYVGPVNTSLGEMYEVHALTGFDAHARAYLDEKLRSTMVRDRLTTAGTTAGMALLLLSTVYGYLRLDTATKGYYSGRLFFAASLAAATVVGTGAYLLFG